MVRYILDLTRPATVKLQREKMGLLKADQEISSLRKAFEDMRVEIDDHHRRLYTKRLSRLLQKLGFNLADLELFSARFTEAIYQHLLWSSITREILPLFFLDHSLQQLQLRFLPEAYICYKGFSIVPTILLAN